jgi:hypothetical protein
MVWIVCETVGRGKGALAVVRYTSGLAVGELLRLSKNCGLNDGMEARWCCLADLFTRFQGGRG